MTDTTAHAAPQAAEDRGAEILRYNSYHVYRRIAGVGEVASAEGAAATDASALAEALSGTVEEMEGAGAQVLGFYDAKAFRAEDDLIVWMMAEDAEALQRAARIFETSAAAQLLEPVWSAVGVHRQHEFSRGHRPSFMDQDEFPRKRWITIYPFVRSYDWYLLEDEDRRRILREHGEMGRKYPQINANTTAAFALGDYEWLLSFEADELHDLVDMMRDLRYTEARLHVREELPFHVGRLLGSLSDVAKILL